jgi:hypothetical protein
MPEAVTRPLRPIQNHSMSACGWRARARRSGRSPCRSCWEGVESVDGLQVALDGAGGLALGAQVALERGREVYARGAIPTKSSVRLCAVGPLC